MDDFFYPLYLHELSQPEKKLLVEIFLAATTSTKTKRSRHSDSPRRSLLTVKALEERARKEIGANCSLRNLLSGAFETGRQLDVPHQKWVFLYNYAMRELPDICKVHDDKALLAMIERLNKLGRKSGRYDRDVHLLNAEYLNFRSWERPIDQRLSAGPYIGFRYSSTLKDIVISVLTIRQAQERHIFTCHTIFGTDDRESRGFVYEPSGRLHLFGLMGQEGNAEFYSLNVADLHADLLNGIMSTISSTGQLHAKQCFFLRMATIQVFQDIAKTFDPSPQGLRRVRNVIERMFEGEGEARAIRRTKSRPLRLSRYLSSDANVQPLDRGDAAGSPGGA